MKFLNWVSWIAGAAATIIILQAFIDLIFKVNLFGVRYIYNYFHVANSLLLLAIFCAVCYRKCDGDKES